MTADTLTDDVDELEERIASLERENRRQAQQLRWHEASSARAKHLLMLTMEQLEQEAARLAEVSRKAEAAANAKAIFLANMRHEIRTPLAGLIGMLELLRTTSLDIEQSDYLETASMSAEMLRSVLNDILDFTKLEAGRAILQEVAFSPGDAIDEIACVFRPKAREKQLDLHVDIAHNVPALCRADPLRIRQTIANLLSNAIKFTERGEVSITATWQDDALMLAIRDSGIGMNPEQLHSIFEPFFQAESALHKRWQGTGLGLAIVNELVDLMEGTIRAESTVGTGTTFFVTLPVTVVENDHTPWPELVGKTIAVNGRDARETRTLSQLARQLGCNVGEDAIARVGVYTSASRIPTIPVQNQRGGHNKNQLIRPVGRLALGRALVRALDQDPLPFTPATPSLDAVARILIVDDNATNLLIAKKFTERCGYRSVTADSGVEALALLDRHAYEVVLMDCQMPGMDGFETTRSIRARPGPQPTIIAVTAAVLDEQRKRCHEVGMDGWLAKPLDMGLLQQYLDDALKQD